MLLFQVNISNFTCARYYFLYVECCDFYVNQSLAGQALQVFSSVNVGVNILLKLHKSALISMFA
jgi:hypothetical protein